ncbi:DUF6397 family protein [Actinacidiphila yeochonensis]|uniref:DUF6397 family protein n=1 Tax=Actinacidiphila yeochonensis TaxID=89050 RepID=UPI000D1A04F7
MSEARQVLGLDSRAFDTAVQLGEVPLVPCGPRTWRVRATEVARLRAEPDHPAPLLSRTRLVGSTEAARLLGVGPERFFRLARAGFIRPVRWYVNRYQALVWLYAACELPAFAERSPSLLRGPLPLWLREAVAAGQDERARGWRARRAAQLVRDAADAWDEAAVWSALLGPQMAAAAVPDAAERAYLRRLRPALPPGRPGVAPPELVREVTQADHPDEIALALLALADALGRARSERPAPAAAAAPGTGGDRSHVLSTDPVVTHGTSLLRLPVAPASQAASPPTPLVSLPTPPRAADLARPPAPAVRPDPPVRAATASETAVPAPAAVPGAGFQRSAAVSGATVQESAPAERFGHVRPGVESVARGTAPPPLPGPATGSDRLSGPSALVRVPAEKAVLPRPLPPVSAASLAAARSAPVPAPATWRPGAASHGASGGGESLLPSAPPPAGHLVRPARPGTTEAVLRRLAQGPAGEWPRGSAPADPAVPAVPADPADAGAITCLADPPAIPGHAAPETVSRSARTAGPERARASARPTKAPGGRHARPGGGPGALLRLLRRNRGGLRPPAGRRQGLSFPPARPNPPQHPAAGPEPAEGGRAVGVPLWAGRPGRPAHSSQSSPTAVIRRTARPSSSEAARSTSAEMPQP